jgi:hypothetical protein
VFAQARWARPTATSISTAFGRRGPKDTAPIQVCRKCSGCDVVGEPVCGTNIVKAIFFPSGGQTGSWQPEVVPQLGIDGGIDEQRERAARAVPLPDDHWSGYEPSAAQSLSATDVSPWKK